MQAIASSCNQSFFSLNAASLYSPYLGDSEALIRDTFKKARQNSPAVVFIDEIDCIVAKRATPGGALSASHGPGEAMKVAVSSHSVSSPQRHRGFG